MHWQQYIDRYLINRILENSDFAKKLEDYQLTDFLQYIKQRRGVIGADLNSLILAHPDRTFTLAFFPEYSELDVLEGIIKAEISRRSHPQAQSAEVEDINHFPALLYPGCLDIAIKAAFEVGLINSSGKWCYTGAKTNAASLYWRAMVVTGLAKAEKAMVYIINGMRAQFSVDLGKNAINKNKKPEAYKRDEQDLYNNLLMAIDRLKKV